MRYKQLWWKYQGWFLQGRVAAALHHLRLPAPLPPPPPPPGMATLTQMSALSGKSPFPWVGNNIWCSEIIIVFLYWAKNYIFSWKLPNIELFSQASCILFMEAFYAEQNRQTKFSRSITCCLSRNKSSLSQQRQHVCTNGYSMFFGAQWLPERGNCQRMNGVKLSFLPIQILSHCFNLKQKFSSFCFNLLGAFIQTLVGSMTLWYNLLHTKIPPQKFAILFSSTSIFA